MCSGRGCSRPYIYIIYIHFKLYPISYRSTADHLCSSVFESQASNRRALFCPLQINQFTPSSHIYSPFPQYHVLLTQCTGQPSTSRGAYLHAIEKRTNVSLSLPSPHPPPRSHQRQKNGIVGEYISYQNADASTTTNALARCWKKGEAAANARPSTVKTEGQQIVHNVEAQTKQNKNDRPRGRLFGKRHNPRSIQNETTLSATVTVVAAIYLHMRENQARGKHKA